MFYLVGKEGNDKIHYCYLYCFITICFLQIRIFNQLKIVRKDHSIYKYEYCVACAASLIWNEIVRILKITDNNEHPEHWGARGQVVERLTFSRKVRGSMLCQVNKKGLIQWFELSTCSSNVLSSDRSIRSWFEAG